MLHYLRRYLSYLVPLTRTIHSPINGPLEVTWYRGRKVLDTRHANYSYGSLQQVLRYGLMFLEPQQAQRILVLGLGGGSVVQTLRQEHRVTAPITALELDPAVIAVADTEFGIRPDANLSIVCADAFVWIQTAPSAAYDLIIIDLFIDLELPAELQQAGFWQDIWRVLPPGGQVLFNTLTANPLTVAGEELTEHLAGLGFSVKEVEVELLNRLLILERLLV
ncbi:spermidine synthase [Hymenobacter sediminicola]|uniref:Fused MFS/spermidine synthase n=1 Tax=Hymenobacter sediminicola TaxID=2761579 RepID=A0A7G7W8Y1_9BACT|nr:fused MFS/spermidine synthase [Hymenobacter sediminicola]QNH62824.1 fused MFS/spermidine synthase [Hymenobacter sediminicola]